MTIAIALNEATKKLLDYSQSPRLDAEVLLAFILKVNKISLLTHPEKKLSSSQVQRYRQRIQRRKKHVPISYLTGQINFFGLSLRVTPAVLVPRPFTELLIEQVITKVQSTNQHTTIADIGTGSGAIAIALASHLPRKKIIATDISAAALRVAKNNARVQHLSKNITFRQGSLLKPLSKKYHPEVIVANLPYLTRMQLKEKSIKREPKIALYGGKLGLQYIRDLLLQTKKFPSINTIALEFDPPQYKNICILLKQWSSKVHISPISDGKKIRGVIASQ